MPTVYLGDVPANDDLAFALSAAGFDVSAEKPPLRPGADDLAVVPAQAGVTSTFRHELNNPLTAVLGFLQLLLRRSDLPADAVDKLTKVQSHGNRVRDLLRRPDGDHA